MVRRHTKQDDGIYTTSVVTSMLCSKVHALRSGTAAPTRPRVVLSTPTSCRTMRVALFQG